MELTRSDIRVDGRRVSIFEWEGRRIRAFADAGTAFKVVELLSDDTIDSVTRFQILLMLLFPDPAAVVDAVKDLSGLVHELLWLVALVDIDGRHKREIGKRVIDWEGDRAYINATLWQTYGMSLEDAQREVTLRELSELISCVPHETPMGQALYYRTADEPKATKHNAEEVKRFRKMRAMWAIKQPEKGGTEPITNEMRDAFLSLAKANDRSA